MTENEYEYVGNCRCGLGPHALYRDKEGKLYHATQVIGTLKEGNVEKQIQPMPERVLAGRGVGPCGDGTPRGGGRGYCGGWKEKSSLQEVK